MCFRYRVGNTLSGSEEHAKWHIKLAQLQLMEGWWCDHAHASYLVIFYSLIQTAKWLFTEEGRGGGKEKKQQESMKSRH